VLDIIKREEVGHRHSHGEGHCQGQSQIQFQKVGMLKVEIIEMPMSFGIHDEGREGRSRSRLKSK
jgi:hypothetical protein